MASVDRKARMNPDSRSEPDDEGGPDGLWAWTIRVSVGIGSILRKVGEAGIGVPRAAGIGTGAGIKAPFDMFAGRTDSMEEPDSKDGSDR